MRPHRTLAALILPVTLVAATPTTASPGNESPVALRPVHLRSVKLRGFWREQVKRLTEKWLPHCVRQMEAGGEGRELLNLVHTARVLRGQEAGEYTGTPWSDAYVYNTIESISLALEVDPEGDADLERAQGFLRRKLDEWIPIVLAAQTDDGYIHSFHTVNKRPRYTNIHHHEFYVQGYLLEAGAAHYRATAGRDRRLYDAARRCADHLCSTFGPPPRRNWAHGHAGMGHALCRLARLVDEVDGAGAGRRYVDLAKYLFDHRHAVEEHRSAYRQSHLPPTEQREAVGHAVRATYFYTAMTDLAVLTGDEAYAAAVDRIWESAVDRRMYITGGVGSTHQGEAFGADHDLPNESAYCESCAGCGLSFWADRMHRMHGDARYRDVQERVVYNNILGAIELSGVNFFYQNPLTSSQRRYSWHGCPCCVGNIPRALIAIKDAMYSVGGQPDTLHVDHFVASSARIERIGGTSLGIEQRTDYPWKGEVSLTLRPDAPATIALRIRVPDRTESALYHTEPPFVRKVSVRVNGEGLRPPVRRGYVELRRRWESGDRVDVSFPLDTLRVHADERVAADRGRVALQRGPLVYAIEDVDHDGQVRAVHLGPEDPLETAWKPDLLDGVVALVRPDGSIFAIPSYARLNRGGGCLTWIPETKELAEPWREPTIASRSRVSTSFETDEGRFDLDAIRDRKVPEASDERGTPLFHWWPHQGTREWVQYDFREPQEVKAVEVYWYDDRGWGGCRVPASWRVLYRVGDGDEWKPVRARSPYGVDRDRFHRVEFEPVTTGALRLDVQLREGVSAGVLEWRVEG